ncbi:Putative heparan-alpha-glucosaminide N-acetyltransferase [Legionella busanensis]|uniref:Heparan-alpha-glucosaminide N-acetyltransferase n=1 Tax=Legionella busanensis TaxID=190655 RepID=A0A378JK37_9GAMM|nr:heparan-alpha-glucosaminide N-acetyltransferase domain-containing protein [Legionella busanensis]STX51534.1 Putative heparan-alpha-glucosaminide N-acetyltransferase [Legionella busanensis]
MDNKNFKFPRLISLDVLRGIIVALMIIVNSPGKQPSYTWIEHSPWNGCTLADAIFPMFIFIVGVSSVFQLSILREKLPVNLLIVKIFKRSLILFAIGLLLNAFPNHFDLSTLRFYGVLQRIAVCYFFAACLFLTTSIRTQFIIFILILISYWLINTGFPGYSGPNLTAEFNIPAQVDRTLFSSAHLYGKYFDPEGLLSTFSSFATALLGNLAGFLLLSYCNERQKFYGLIVAGFLSMLLGWLWSFYFPINKTLWTSSYVLWTGGISLLALAGCYWLIEIRKLKAWSYPFRIFGITALLVYVLHIVFLKIQVLIQISYHGTQSNLKTFITDSLFNKFSAQNASLSYAICYMLFWLLCCKLLFKKARSLKKY